MTKITFKIAENGVKEVEKSVKGGIRILDAALSINLRLTSICGGRGSCGKCKMKVLSGHELLTDVTPIEKKLMTDEELKEGYRLACLARVKEKTGTLKLQIPKTSILTEQILQVEGVDLHVSLNPMVQKYFVELPKPNIENPVSDEDRLIVELEKQFKLDKIKLGAKIIHDLPLILREANWKVTAVTWNGEIIAVEKGDSSRRNYGFAVDIGTTKVAGFLVDLDTGKTICRRGIMNPQIKHGEDVVSRITYVMEKGQKGLKELQKEIIQGINQLMVNCCRETGVSEENIYEHVFVGNTCMQLLFLGVWPVYLALSPYTPVLRRGVNIDSAELGLKGNKGAKTYFLPVIGGFVGADNVAVVLVTDILNSEERVMAIDVGTNTEIDIGNKEIVMATSCASGPAFEGMHIKHGMKAAAGAIERFSVDISDPDKVYYLTIGDKKPIGICGSAMIDIVANLFKAGLIDERGTFNKDLLGTVERLRKGEKGLEYVIAWKEETESSEDIVFTQQDVREVQKAKAAIHTGAKLLMKEMKLKEEDIYKVYIAGAFGNYIDPENARVIGMYPEFPLKIIEFIGNAAGTGARLTLLSKEKRRYAENISEKVKYLELAAHKGFSKEYFDSLYIPHREINEYPHVKKLLGKIRSHR